MRSRNLLALPFAVALLSSSCSSADKTKADLRHRAEAEVSAAQSQAGRLSESGLKALAALHVGVDTVQAAKDAQGEHYSIFDLGGFKSTLRYVGSTAVIRTGLVIPGLSANVTITAACQAGDLHGTAASNLGQTIGGNIGGIHIRPNFTDPDSDICRGDQLVGQDGHIIRTLINGAFS